MRSRALTEINKGDEITFFYGPHFFGPHNVDCLCKKEHFDPLGNALPARKKKRKLLSNIVPEVSEVSGRTSEVSEVSGWSSGVADVVYSYRRVNRPVEILVCHRYAKHIRFDTEVSAISSDESEAELLDYERVFGCQTFDVPVATTVATFPANDSETDSNSPLERIAENSDIDILVDLPAPLGASTPIRLSQFEDGPHCVDILEPDSIPVESDMLELPLYEDSPISRSQFHDTIENLAQKYSWSDVENKDIMGLFPKVLPRPNNVLSELLLKDLPMTHSFEFDDSILVCCDGRAQLAQLVKANRQSIVNSWRMNCGYSQTVTPFAAGELQFATNIDGVPLYKSRSLTLWPVWVQCGFSI